jgi:hypothetical protein
LKKPRENQKKTIKTKKNKRLKSSKNQKTLGKTIVFIGFRTKKNQKT